MIKSNPVRLYQFYSFDLGKRGTPFAMCDNHKADYQSPDSCTIIKIADKAVESCNLCEQKEAKWKRKKIKK